jgi:hypothetical protein
MLSIEILAMSRLIHPFYHSREEDLAAETQWLEAEDMSMAKAEEDARAQALEEETHPTRRPIHKLFNFVSMITSISALLMGLGQILGIAVQQVCPIQYVLRVYVIVLSFLVILVELEWTQTIRNSSILNIWITRDYVMLS